jgi:uncharacterized protein (TIGR03067 family)
MRRATLLLSAMLVLPLLGSDSPKEYNDAAQMDSIEGSWQLLAVEHDGRKVNSITWILTFRGGKFTREDSDGDQGMGVYNFDTKQKPYHLDLIPERGTKYAVSAEIAHIHGDTLRTDRGAV